MTAIYLIIIVFVLSPVTTISAAEESFSYGSSRYEYIHDLELLPESQKVEVTEYMDWSRFAPIGGVVCMAQVSARNIFNVNLESEMFATIRDSLSERARMMGGTAILFHRFSIETNAPGSPEMGSYINPASTLRIVAKVLRPLEDVPEAWTRQYGVEPCRD